MFGSVDDSLLTLFAQHGAHRRIGRGEFIWRADSSAVSFTIIEQGLVKIVRAGHDGIDAIVGLFGPRQSIGDTAAIQRGRYPADAVAASEQVTVLQIDASRVLGAMEHYPSVAASLNAALIEHSQALQQKIWIMTAGTVPRRLASLLLYLAERFGRREGTCCFIPLHLSRSELAALVGATVETTIRAMSRWQKERLVETTANGFLLCDRARLEQLMTSG